MAGVFKFSTGNYNAQASAVIRDEAPGLPILGSVVSGDNAMSIMTVEDLDPAAINDYDFLWIDGLIEEGPYSFGNDAQGHRIDMRTHGFYFSWAGQDTEVDWHGGGKADVMIGGNAEDKIDGRGGDDRITGGLFDDLSGGTGNDTFFIDDNPVAVHGGSGSDTLVITQSLGIEAVITSIEKVVVENGVSLHVYFGPSGLNIYSRSVDGGWASLGGTAGNDRIFAKAGDDSLLGWEGNDLLVGGSGEDTFHYRTDWGRDTINNFTKGADTIFINEDIDFNDLDIAVQANRSVIDFGEGNLLIVNGVTNLAASDFEFFTP